jgi:photosystem II stability/assembly factor-like uncharacterized protein
VSVLDAQTLIAVADLSLPTEAPTDAVAVASGPDHQLIVGTRTVLASLDMNPEKWKSTACQLVGRALTEDEWTRFLPSIPFAPACD